MAKKAKEKKAKKLPTITHYVRKDGSQSITIKGNGTDLRGLLGMPAPKPGDDDNAG